MYENFKNFVDTEVYDIVSEKSTMGSLQDLVDFAEVIFVSVPTPANLDGSCNTIFVENLVKSIYSLKKHAKIVIKSTVTPGTSKNLAKRYPEMLIAFNPEFLTEANSYDDFKNQKIIVIGSEDEEFGTSLREFYFDFVRKNSKVTSVKIVNIGTKEAEAYKYLANCFLATKLTFANEIYDLCEEGEIDYQAVVSVAELDERLGATHWRVPGKDNIRGWGGSCFPKDTLALSTYANDVGVKLELLNTAISLNRNHRTL
jgi:UDPglucose 6-dehydrogenase